MLRDYERLENAGDLRRTLQAFRKGIACRGVRCPRRRRRKTQLDTPSNAAVAITISTKTAEGIGYRINDAGEVKSNHLLQTRIEVRCWKHANGSGRASDQRRHQMRLNDPASSGDRR